MTSQEASERVLLLEHAIRRLNYLKKHLNQNVSDIKAEIHANVSLNLKCLWDREVCLLNQVDQTLRVMEETLQHQQTKLSQTLGVVQTGLSMALDGAASEKQLAEILDRLKKLELTPENIPHISFRADHVNLQEAILNYGQVDGGGLSQVTAFSYPGCSASLAHHVQDSDIQEQHTFFKAGEEIKRAQVSSNHFDDWLQTKVPDKKIEDNIVPWLQPMAHPRTEFGDILAVNLPPGNSYNLSNWPGIVKQNVDLKQEHGLKIVDHSCYQKASTETNSPGAQGKKHANLLQPVRKSLKNWLSRSSGCPSSLSSSTFFKHVPTDSKMWLQQACQQLTSLNDLKHKDFFRHVSKEPSSWLYQQAYRKQQVASPDRPDRAAFFSHVSKDKDFWLQQKDNTHKLEKNDCIANSKADRSHKTTIRGCCKKLSVKEDDRMWLSTSTASTPVFPLKGVCRANELCGNMSECVSQPDCCTLWFRKKAAVKNVVDPAESFKPLSLEPHEWLSPVSQRHVKLLGTFPNDKEVDGLKQDMQDNASDSIWLMNPAVSTALNVSITQSPLGKFKDNKEESNLCLQKTASAVILEPSSSVQTTRSSSTCSDLTMSDWLMLPAEDNDKHQELLDPDKDSEGWSICSDHNSACTDQRVKDIEAADEYYSKWLF